MPDKKAWVAVLDGPDAVGKSFLSSLLAAFFWFCGYRAERVCLPEVESSGSGLTLIKPALRGIFQYDPLTMGMLFVANRLELLGPLVTLMSELDFLVLDRFWTANCYQVAEDVLLGYEAEWARRVWEECDKHFIAAVQPDSVFILLNSLQEAQIAISRRSERQAASVRKTPDRVERNERLQRLVREEYARLLQSHPAWHRLEVGTPPPLGESRGWARNLLGKIAFQVARDCKQWHLLLRFPTAFPKAYQLVQFGGRYTSGDLVEAFDRRSKGALL